MGSLYKFLLDKGQLVALLLGVLVVAIIAIQVFTGLSGAGYDTSTDLVPLLKADPNMDIGFFNGAIGLPTILLIIIIAIVIVFTIINFIKFPKTAIRALISVGVMGVLFAILYATSTSETTGGVFEAIQKFDVSEGVSKLISAGIKTTGVLVLGAIVVMVGGEIRNLFK